MSQIISAMWGRGSVYYVTIGAVLAVLRWLRRRLLQTEEHTWSFALFLGSLRNLIARRLSQRKSRQLSVTAFQKVDRLNYSLFLDIKRFWRLGQARFRCQLERSTQEPLWSSLMSLPRKRDFYHRTTTLALT